MPNPKIFFLTHPIIRLVALLFTVIWLGGCAGSASTYHTEKKYSPQQLQEDFDIGWKTYQKNHPAYDWYTPADSVNARFARVRASLTDSLTEAEFRVRLAYAVSMIRCGHTSVISSKAYLRYSKKSREPIFPLAIRVWDKDSMVVAQNLLKDSSAIQRGAVVIAINNIPASVFIEQMKQYVSTDGFSEPFKEVQISSGFAARFKWMYGLPKQYTVSYLDTTGNVAREMLPNYQRPKKDTTKTARTDSLIRINNRGKKPIGGRGYGSLKIDSARDLAILELNNFSNVKVPKLIRTSFRTISKAGIPNLAIDLRANGGGKIDNSTLLTRYVINKPFRVADSVSAKDLRIAYPRYVQASWLYRYFRWLIVKKQADGRYHMQKTERDVFKPKKKHHFDGKVYVLTGGSSFSASTLFLSKVHSQANVLTVGEETGGGARGNSSVMVPRITLPNTGVQLRLPLFKIITDVSIPANGRGILPDVEVKPNSWYIRHNIDRKMEKVYELVEKGKGP